MRLYESYLCNDRWLSVQPSNNKIKHHLKYEIDNNLLLSFSKTHVNTLFRKDKDMLHHKGSPGSWLVVTPPPKTRPVVTPLY
ncbi:CLUMA_CG008321, isoform A [Clunio marinus]|uniref:CLUMA_CG008321, isoform A n=1 Tax=Clunio marinus TaxID=568069 RepID=A0A1J1I3Q3_9DIPT|nr:CLUMA_CG008321, isoform A [Clunio marinus]